MESLSQRGSLSISSVRNRDYLRVLSYCLNTSTSALIYLFSNSNRFKNKLVSPRQLKETVYSVSSLLTVLTWHISFESSWACWGEPRAVEVSDGHRRTGQCDAKIRRGRTWAKARWGCPQRGCWAARQPHPALSPPGRRYPTWGTLPALCPLYPAIVFLFGEPRHRYWSVFFSHWNPVITAVFQWENVSWLLVGRSSSVALIPYFVDQIAWKGIQGDGTWIEQVIDNSSVSQMLRN